MRSPFAPSAAGWRRSVHLLVVVALATAAACGRGRTGGLVAPAPSDECRLVGGSGSGESAGRGVPGARGDETVRLGLVHPVDAGSAPVPRNPDEALVFRHLYETLIRFDCAGRPYAGLASEWTSAEGGRRWTFVLRDEARFWDGSPVRATDVAASWRAAEASGRGPWRDRRALSVAVEGERRITVEFVSARRAVPAALAEPASAVVREAPGEAWPVGTGPYRVERSSAGRPLRGGHAPGRTVASGPERTMSSLVLRAVRDDPGMPREIRIRVQPGADPRDLLDAGADVVITGDRRTLAYARLRPELASRTLPWSRSYVLVVPRSRAPGAPAPFPAEFLEALARDGVRAEARRPPEDAPRIGGDSCLVPAGSGGGPGQGERPGDGPASGPRRIVHPRDDATARELAERLVALAAPSPDAAGQTDAAFRSLGLVASPGGFVAAAADGDETGAVLAEGLAAAAVIGLSSARLGSCSEPGRAADAAASPGEEPGSNLTGSAAPAAARAPSRPPAYRILPLIETRRRIVARSVDAVLAVDADGTPHFVRSREAPR